MQQGLTPLAKCFSFLISSQSVDLFHMSDQITCKDCVFVVFLHLDNNQAKKPPSICDKPFYSIEGIECSTHSGY